MHGIHCIQSCCMESTAFNRDALGLTPWTPLHSILMLLAMLHKIHCIQSCCRESTAFKQDAFYQAAWNPLHGIHSIQSGCILPGCMVPLHSIMLHGLHCIQSRCMESTAYNRDPLRQNALNLLHSMTLHGMQRD